MSNVKSEGNKRYKLPGSKGAMGRSIHYNECKDGHEALLPVIKRLNFFMDILAFNQQSWTDYYLQY